MITDRLLLHCGRKTTEREGAEGDAFSLQLGDRMVTRRERQSSIKCVREETEATEMLAPALNGGGAHRALVTGGFLLFSSSLVLLCLHRKRARHRVWRQRVTYKKLSKTSVCTDDCFFSTGGTLAKIVYFERHETSNDHRKRPRSASHDVAVGEMNKFLEENQSFGHTGVQDVRLRILSKALNGAFHFVRFESNKTQKALEFIASNGINQSLRTLPCTGGGAHKLVSIGSGVSVLYVKGPGDYERVSGSSIGGGTYWGLCRLMTKCESYDEALDLCVHGSNHSVDMSVGDIYGGSYEKFNLPATTVASSFGKMISVSRDSVRDADLARSLLVMITQNIGQIAFLNACLYKTKHIFFVGNFLRHNKISSRTLAYAINFWSNGAMEARFCKHEGYLGALGAFLRHAEATNAHGEEFVSATRGSKAQ
ncbi:hypothetical protein BBJ28_00010884 [Nothophytophthora sp. Chile5]|nr:hypothetical protein BBJ28_00010884 [Nothophytophthora sp. Chile5]